MPTSVGSVPPIQAFPPDWLNPMRRPAVIVALLASFAILGGPIAATPAFGAATPSIRSSASELAADPASDPITWSVKPADDSKGGRVSFEYSTDPGTAIKDWVVIANSGTVAADFRVYATDAINDFESGDISLLPANKAPSDIGAWVTLNLAELRLEPGTQATVPFDLLIPSDASPGDHTAGIIASSTTTGEKDGQQVVVDQRVATRINLRVSGEIAPSVETSGFVSSFSPSLNPFAPGSVGIDYAVRNNGNIRLDVKQKLDIVGPFGIPLGQVTPEPVQNLLPGQAARVKADVSGVGALLLAWSSVELVPGPVGSAAAPADEPDAVADPNAPAEETVDPNALVEFTPASATSMTLAVSWTLLALIVVLLVAAFFVVRYVRVTRERYWAAIDQAEADARQSADGGGARPLAEVSGR